MENKANHTTTYQTIDDFSKEIGYKFENELFKHGIRIHFLQSMFLEFFDLVENHQTNLQGIVLSSKGNSFNRLDRTNKNHIAQQRYEEIIFTHLGSWIQQVAVDGLPKLQEKNQKLTLETLLPAIIGNEVKKLHESFNTSTQEFQKRIRGLSLQLKKHKSVQLDGIKTKLEIQGVFTESNISDYTNYHANHTNGINFEDGIEGYEQIKVISENNSSDHINKYFQIGTGISSTFLYHNIGLIDNLFVPGIEKKDINWDKIKVNSHPKIAVGKIEKNRKNYIINFQLFGNKIKNTNAENILLNTFEYQKNICKQEEFGNMSKFEYIYTILTQIRNIDIAYIDFRANLKTATPISVSAVSKTKKTAPTSNPLDVFIKLINKTYGKDMGIYFLNQLKNLHHVSFEKLADGKIKIGTQKHQIILQFETNHIKIFFVQHEKIIGSQTVQALNHGIIGNSPVLGNPFYEQFCALLKNRGVTQYLLTLFHPEEVDIVQQSLRSEIDVSKENNGNQYNLLTLVIEKFGLLKYDHSETTSVRNSTMTGEQFVKLSQKKCLDAIASIFMDFAEKVDYRQNEYITDILDSKDKLTNEIETNFYEFYIKSSEFKNKLRPQVSENLSGDSFSKDVKERLDMIGYNSKDDRVFSRRLTMDRLFMILFDSNSFTGGKGMLELLSSDKITEEIKNDIRNYLNPYFDYAIQLQSNLCTKEAIDSFAHRNEQMKKDVYLLGKALVGGNEQEIKILKKTLIIKMDEYESYVKSRSTTAQDDHSQKEKLREEEIAKQNETNLAYNQSIAKDVQITNDLNIEIKKNNEYVKNINKNIDIVDGQIKQTRHKLFKIEQTMTGSMVSNDHLTQLSSYNAQITDLQKEKKGIKGRILVLNGNISTINSQIDQMIDEIQKSAYLAEDLSNLQAIQDQVLEIKEVKKETNAEKQKLSEELKRLQIKKSNLQKSQKKKKQVQSSIVTGNQEDISILDIKIQLLKDQINVLNSSLKAFWERICVLKKEITIITNNLKTKLMDQDEFEHYTKIANDAEILRIKRNEIANTPESLLSISEKRNKYAELRIYEKNNKAELKNLQYKVSEKYFTQEQVEQIEKYEENIKAYSKNIQSETDELDYISGQINKVIDDRNLLKTVIEESKSTEIQKQVLKNCREEIIVHESLIQKSLNDIDTNIEISRLKKSIHENGQEITNLEKNIKKFRVQTSNKLKIYQKESKNNAELIKHETSKLTRLRTDQKILTKKLQTHTFLVKTYQIISQEKEKIVEAEDTMRETKLLINEGRMTGEQKKEYAELRLILNRLVLERREIASNKKGMRIKAELKYTKQKPMIIYEYKPFKEVKYEVNSTIKNIYEQILKLHEKTGIYLNESTSQEERQIKYLRNVNSLGGLKRYYPTVLREMQHYTNSFNNFPVVDDTIVGLCEIESQAIENKKKGFVQKFEKKDKKAYESGITGFAYKQIKEYFDDGISQGFWFEIYRINHKAIENSQLMSQLFYNATMRHLSDNLNQIITKGTYENQIANSLGLFDKNTSNKHITKSSILQVCKNFREGERKESRKISIPTQDLENLLYL